MKSVASSAANRPSLKGSVQANALHTCPPQILILHQESTRCSLLVHMQPPQLTSDGCHSDPHVHIVLTINCMIMNMLRTANVTHLYPPPPCPTRPRFTMLKISQCSTQKPRCCAGNSAPVPPVAPLRARGRVAATDAAHANHSPGSPQRPLAGRPFTHREASSKTSQQPPFTTTGPSLK